jgi:hypothetical protein
MQSPAVDEQSAPVHPGGHVDVDRRRGELVEGGREPAAAEQQQGLLAVDEPEQVVRPDGLRPP